jgi:lipopolysaccharide biosynthesis protein
MDLSDSADYLSQHFPTLDELGNIDAHLAQLLPQLDDLKGKVFVVTHRTTPRK